MDKNQIIGFILILLIVIGWSIMTAPTQEELDRQKAVQDSISMVQDVPVSPTEAISESTVASTPQAAMPIDNQDSAYQVKLANTYGDFASNAVGEEELIELKGDKATFIFTNKGGRLRKTLLNVNDHAKLIDVGEEKNVVTDLYLFEDEKNKFEYLIPVNGRMISTEDLFFTAKKTGNQVSFTANTPSGKLVQEYSLLDDGYTLDYNLKFINLNNTIDRNKSIILNWNNYLDKVEKNVTFEKFYTTVYFKEADENSDYCSCRADDDISAEGKSIEWASHVNQYFNTSLMAVDRNFSGAEFETKILEDDADDLKLIKTTLGIPYGHGSSETLAMKLYSGPNLYENLTAFDNNIEDIIPYGRSLFGSINRQFIRPFFNWISSFVGSKGIVILIVIFILKMLLYPLMYKMLESQAKMGALKPKLAPLKEKFKDEPQKIQMENMKMYREYGVSPLGGCLPMVVQIPIWYALFRFFPADITFRQESFLWANDLSSYDAFINLPFDIPMMGAHLSLFTILWAITQVMYTYYNTQHMDMSANPAMKYMQYLMPIMFFFFFNNYASALTSYMFFSMLINIIQTIVTKKFVFNDEKILAELEEKKKNAKPKKKGGFQARIEEAMKQQQQIKEQQSKKSSNRRKKK